ncbi:RNA ligase family protein [Xanthocytophaga flava]|uniref:RNA ligase family protein n=1 Tax=Xanthocytophaga flava TaxID=3048013 RepID=UPI0028D15577|nr:RNA ligase family protein [Xanthocytophaga flavus]MDJ1472632.1 RNA ligase family protein [Xanthocytophaga flavus]
MITIKKYPRTRHIEGSRLQKGDEDLKSVPFEEIKGKFLVIEEKMDGANAGISFSERGELLLQSRGHYLTGGYRERHFDLLKTWANTYAPQMWDVIGDEYIIYGEWMYAKHTVYYTDLPHYFLEFDIYDKVKDVFLSTFQRRDILEFMPFMKSVKILFEGPLTHKEQFYDFITHSHFINDHHMECLKSDCEKLGLRYDIAAKETNPSPVMEGLYIKQENEQIVEDRFKFVRADFLTSILDSETHWLDRPIIPNRLAEGVNLFE